MFLSDRHGLPRGRKKKISKEARRRWKWLKTEHQQQLRELESSYPGQYTLEQFTCATCSLVQHCEVAFDFRNVEGFCLAEK